MSTPRDRADERIMLLHHGTRTGGLPAHVIAQAAVADCLAFHRYRQRVFEWEQNVERVGRENAGSRPAPPPQSQFTFLYEIVKASEYNARKLILDTITRGALPIWKSTDEADPLPYNTRMVHASPALLAEALEHLPALPAEAAAPAEESA